MHAVSKLAPKPVDRAREPSDAELVERMVGGDRWAREALYRKYFASVWGLVLRLLRNRVETEDVVQDVFAIAFEEYRDLRDGSAIRQWLMKIAVHQVHRRFRRRKLLRVLGLDRGGDEVTLESLAQPGVSAESRAELAKLDGVLTQIPPPRRVAWSLRHVEGYDLQEVAAACDCSVATAKRWIRDADDVIRQHVSIKEADHG